MLALITSQYDDWMGMAMTFNIIEHVRDNINQFQVTPNTASQYPPPPPYRLSVTLPPLILMLSFTSQISFSRL